MANLNTTASHSNIVPDIYYRKKLLTIFDEELQLYKLGVKTPLPQGNGKVVKWNKFSKLSAKTTALVEGTPPTDTALTSSVISTTVYQYGDYIKLTDFLEMTSIQDVAAAASERLGKSAALSIDTIIRDVLDAALPNQFASGGAALTDVGSDEVLTSKELLKARTTLRTALVGPHSNDEYVLVVSPAGEADLMNDTADGSWLDMQKYIDPASKRPINGSIGKIFGVRILRSDNLSSTTTGTKSSQLVYSNLFFGEECYGVVDLGGKNIQTFTKPAGSAGTLDPLNQVGSIGWKAPGFAAKYLGGSPDRGLRIRAGSAY